MVRTGKRWVLALPMLSVPAFAFAQGTAKFAGRVELSGPGATSGTNLDEGAKLAIKEINAAGGILGASALAP